MAIKENEIKTMLRVQLAKAAHLLKGHKVVLFGSRARGLAQPRSDYDVGVYGEGPLPLKDFFAIEDLLDELPTLYSIDWVDLNRVSAEFRRRAMQKTEVLYE